MSKPNLVRNDHRFFIVAPPSARPDGEYLWFGKYPYAGFGNPRFQPKEDRDLVEALRIPVLVLRKNTERPEGIEAGCAKLAGVTKGSIIQAVEAIINDEQLYRSMATVKNPYGDGTAASQILKLLQTRCASQPN